jgi:nitrate reductase NapE component
MIAPRAFAVKRIVCLCLGTWPALNVALLGMSGVVLSILPTGAIPSGLAALAISTLLLYRLVRAVALLDPDTPSARLLPIDDTTAQRTWTWAVRLIRLAAVYFLITRGLLTVGVAEELYQVVRGVMIVIVASVVSALIARLTPARRSTVTAPSSGDDRRLWSGVIATLRQIWPIIAIAYVWCVALLALLSFQRDAALMAVASVQMAVVIVACIVLL